MSENERKPETDGLDIDELLADFNRQKEEHESNFGTLEPPVRHEKKKPERREKKQEEPQPEPKGKEGGAPKKKKKMPKKDVRKWIAGIAVLCVLALLAGVAGGAVYSKTAYLRNYRKQYPDVNFPDGIRKEYCEQYAQQTNTLGYIKLPDCSYESYVFSSSSVYPVLDGNCSSSDLSFNTVVYMNTADIGLEEAYGNAEAYLNSAQIIDFSTLYEDYRFTVIGAFYTNSVPADDNGYVFPYNLTVCPVGNDFENYTDRLYHRFLYNTDYQISRDDKLLTLATKCSFMPNFRFVVVAVLNGEVQQNAETNMKVHYPQIWYDENEQKNPYDLAAKWYPTIPINNGEETTHQTIDDFTRY